MEGAVVSTGHPALDAELPGGGWPVGSLVEVLQARDGQHLWQLALPALASHGPGRIVLVDPPFVPFTPSLCAHGLGAERLIRIEARKPAARLWAAEQAVRCKDVSAVLAWLPQVRSPELRRLHLAAALHERLLFVFRPASARHESSPARVRLFVEDHDELRVQVLKRRGPPLALTLPLRTHSDRLTALLASRRQGALHPLPTQDRSHVLDRTLALA